jgi:cobalt/nickel transport system permease protein
MSPATFDPYVHRDSWLHQRDPRAKLAGTLLFLLAIALTGNAEWLMLATWMILMLLLARLGRLPSGLLLARSLVALPFVLGAFALPLTVPGEVIARLPLLGWPLSGEGMERASSLILRAWISVQTFALLTATTRIRDLLWSLEELRVPPVVVAVIGFAFRYLSLSRDEAGRMMRARRSRTVHQRGRGIPLRRQAHTAGGMVGTLLLRGLDRSERVHAAMMARGYDGTTRRLSQFEFSGADRVVLASGVLALLAAWIV